MKDPPPLVSERCDTTKIFVVRRYRALPFPKRYHTIDRALTEVLQLIDSCTCLYVVYCIIMKVSDIHTEHVVGKKREDTIVVNTSSFYLHSVHTVYIQYTDRNSSISQ